MNRRRFLRALAGATIALAAPIKIAPAKAVQAPYRCQPFRGLVGDGIADDTAALQAMLNATARAGGVLRVPTGVFRLTGPITIPLGTALVTSDSRYEIEHGGHGFILPKDGGRHSVFSSVHILRREPFVGSGSAFKLGGGETWHTARTVEPWR